MRCGSLGVLMIMVLLGSVDLYNGDSDGRLQADEGRWPDVLANTSRLQREEPLDVVMVGGMDRFAERELAASAARRRAAWPKEKPGSKEFAKALSARRDRLREIIGAVDTRRPASLSVILPSHISTNALPFMPSEGRSAPVAIPVRWDVLEGVSAEGVLLLPAGEVRGHAVCVPDASWTPEMFCGLAEGVVPESQWPRRLVQRGVVVLVPTLISRDDEFSGQPDIRHTNIPHREYVYRMAFEMGRHIIGYEVQKILAAVDVLEQMAAENGHDHDIGICGVGDGGQLAMSAAALDERIAPTLVSGYFQERKRVWREPIDRNIWSQLVELGDAEIAALAASGELFIEASSPPAWDGPQPARAGRPDYAAPGVIRTPPIESVRREFTRLQSLTLPQQVTLVETEDGTGPPGSSHAFDQFAAIVSRQSTGLIEEPPLTQPANVVDPRRREQRQLAELIRFTQRLLHRSDKVRAKRWSTPKGDSLEAWQQTAHAQREYVHEHVIGRLATSAGPKDVRSRKVFDEPTHVGYEVEIDILPGMGNDDAGVIAGGVLLLPKDLKEGERRPVVVCQHGLEGTPADTITTDPTARAWRAYKGFSTQLVERGFIVYAPQNPYRGEHDFRVIQRKSNPVGRSLFSYIIEQHRWTLDWLGRQPWVDRERIAFYGLSYGGKTAVRVPPFLLLQNAASGNKTSTNRTPIGPGYCLSICSGDFNEWIRKCVSNEDRYSYIHTKEYEMFEWNMGHVVGYAELASLMIPLPFMVERGHHDGVAPDEWVAWEYAKVRRRYDLLGIGDRTEIEFFNGPHTINAQGTFAFLHRHLDWPVPSNVSDAE